MRKFFNWQKYDDNHSTIRTLICDFQCIGFYPFLLVFGRQLGLDKALPTKEIGEKAIQPPKIATLIVGVGLILFGLIYLTRTGLINIVVPSWIISYGSWLVPSIFIIRVIGDFNYVGLFKKIKNTEFAKADSKWFIPLCSTIGLLGILIQLMDK